MAPKAKHCATASSRVSLTTSTHRKLWAESAGYCQKPQCGIPLFDDDSDADFAEMAHIIPASTGGPRDVPAQELSPQARAKPDNIAVLCANCHTVVDKSPTAYPADMIREWKRAHRKKVADVLAVPEFIDRAEARAYVEPRLSENRQIFDTYGPRPGDFDEARSEQWHRHAVSTIVPNNTALMRAMQRNRALLTDDERATAAGFTLHAIEFEARHIAGEHFAVSQQFPEALSSVYEGDT